MTRMSYPTDLNDEQWNAIRSLVPQPKPGGRPAKYTRREIVNAILYQARNGAVWRGLPHDLPPYRIVFHYFRCWQTDGTWDRIHDRLRTRSRQRSTYRVSPAGEIPQSDLGRCRLSGRGFVGLDLVAVDLGGGRRGERPKGLRRAAEALDRGTHFRLAQSLASSVQRLRTHDREFQSLCSSSDDSSNGPA